MSAPAGRIGRRIGISLDGGMVAIRGEGWKEVKVGSIGRIARRWTPEGQEERLENLRTAVLSDTFDTLWQAAA